MSASHKGKYPEYKDSGRQWLKEIPSHWNTPKFGQVFRERRTKVSDKDFDALSVTKKGIVPQLATAAKTDHGDNRKLVLKGDFVINSRSDRKGSSGVSPLNGSVSTISIVLEILKGNNRYIHHLLRSHDFKEEFYRLGHGIVADLWSTRFDDIKGELLCFPPEKEQEQISDYLDFADKGIVDLVKDLERLLDMLKEKRSALITQMVTNGLSNDTTNWKNTKIKYCLSMKGRLGWQGLKADEYQNTGPYVVSSAHFSNYKIRWEECPRVSLERYLTDENIQLREGDVLLMKDGASLGKIAQVSNQPDLACLNSHLLLLRPNSSEILEKFVFYLLDSMHFQDYMLDQGKGSTFLGVSQESIGNYAFSLPDTNEQLRIVKYLDEKIRLIDEISDNLIDKIKKCKELCKSLISAAVTGKIDVRGL